VCNANALKKMPLEIHFIYLGPEEITAFLRQAA
jgi:hypothetical protein